VEPIALVAGPDLVGNLVVRATQHSARQYLASSGRVVDTVRGLCKVLER